MGFVVDASVTLAWCFSDERTEATERLLDRVTTEQVVAPALWVTETTNALLSAVRRGRLLPEQAKNVQALIGALPIEVDSTPPDRQELFAVARRHNLSSYDASYLLLAQRRDLPLTTLDTRLHTAALAAGSDVLPAR